MAATGSGNGRWIVIPRWEEFQHRDAARVLVPTWIKFMTRLLSDEAYLGLTGHRRAILHGIWLEYARSLRQLPDDTGTLTRRLNLKVTRADLGALNHAGFIELHASRPASSDASTSAGTEKRREEDPLTPAERGNSRTNGTSPRHTGTNPRAQAAAQKTSVQCPDCGMGFPSQRRVDEHLENVHGIYADAHDDEPALDDEPSLT